MSKKDRLFIFGDSWAENLFRAGNWVKENLNPIGIPGIPYHLEDYLAFHYDVHNFAQGGSPNSEIIYQLSNLPPHVPGDRILIIWSHHIRFSLWKEDGGVVNYGDFNLPFEDKPKSPLRASKEVYDSIHGRLNQLVLAEQTPIDEIPYPKIREEFKFYNWITTMLLSWEPVAITWEPTLAKILNIPPIHYGAEFFNNEKITIKDEYGLEDAHLGGRGNYLLYKYVLKLLNNSSLPIDQSYRIEEKLEETFNTDEKKDDKILH